MTSPAGPLDGYVDLTLFDVDVTELVARALERATIAFPDWRPREGNIELVLLEAFALEVQELAYVVNRLPSTLTEVLLRLFELEPSPGVPPTVLATFAVQATGQASIPDGTQLALVLADGLEPVVFRTVGETIIPPGATTASAPAVATRPTPDANSTRPGSPAVLLDALSFANSVTVTITGAGTRPEDTRAFLDRGVARFRRLVQTLVRPEHYTAAAEEFPEVERAVTLDRYDPAQVPPTGRRGHVTTAVAGPAGAPTSAPFKATLKTALESQGHAGLEVHVIDTTRVPVDVTTILTRFPGSPAATVRAAAEKALRDYLNPDVRPFGAKVHRNELIALLDRVPGVDLVTLTVPAADVELAGAAPIAVAGQINVSVPG